MPKRESSVVLFLKKFARNASPIVFSDLDGTIRWGKGSVSSEIQDAIYQFRKRGGFFIPITGGPEHHIPEYLVDPIGFCESGAVLICKQRIKILAPQDELRALRVLCSHLGIRARDGSCRILGKYDVIIEGPRRTALTLVSGKHSLYPHVKADAPLGEIEHCLKDLIEKYAFSLRIIRGMGDGYSWMDITTNFKKEQAVNWFLDVTGKPYIYFLGDGMNDYDAMNLPRVIPVGFKNTEPEIKKLIKIRDGILIENKEGPDGGISEALRIITSRPVIS